MKFLDLHVSSALASQNKSKLLEELQEKGFEGIGIVYDAAEQGGGKGLKEIKVGVGETAFGSL